MTETFNKNVTDCTITAVNGRGLTVGPYGRIPYHSQKDIGTRFSLDFCIG